MIKKIYSDDKVIFTINNYYNTGLNFIRSAFLAKVLGPFEFGRWGIILLIFQVLRYSDLGVVYSMNREISIKKNSDSSLIYTYINTTFSIEIVISGLLVLLAWLINIFHINIYSNYHIDYYLILIALMAALDNFKVFLENIFRGFQQFKKIILLQSVFSTLGLLLVILTINWAGLTGILLALIISYLIAIGVVIKPYFRNLTFTINFHIIRKLLSVGLVLLFYNVSYFILLSISRYFVSIYYSVSELGTYTLAFSIANGAIIALNSIAYVIFPKQLNFFGNSKDNLQISHYLLNSTKKFTLISSALVFISFLFIPLFKHFFHEYTQINTVLGFILIGQYLLNFSVIATNLLIAKDKQLLLAIMALIIIIITVVANIIIIHLHLTFIYLVAANSFSMILYSAMILLITGYLINGMNNILKFVKYITIRQSFPFLLILIGIIKNIDSLIYMGFPIFILLNYREIKAFYREYTTSIAL